MLARSPFYVSKIGEFALCSSGSPFNDITVVVVEAATVPSSDIYDEVVLAIASKPHVFNERPSYSPVLTLRVNLSFYAPNPYLKNT